MVYHLGHHLAIQHSVDIVIHCAHKCERGAEEFSGDMMMTECIRLWRDCAQICWTTAAFMSRGSQFIPALAHICLEICEACATECEKHHNKHCYESVIACRTTIATVGVIA